MANMSSWNIIRYSLNYNTDQMEIKFYYQLILKIYFNHLPISTLAFMKYSVISVILAQRLWQSGAGLVTIFLVIHFLTPVQQGWYYSFLSLAALYTLFDLGLSIILTQHSARLFIKLKWINGDYIEGENLSDFLALIGHSFRVYLILALTFILLVLPIGLLFLSTKDGGDSLLNKHWITPWIILIFSTAANLLILPYLSIIEGSGKISDVYGVRITQNILGAIGCWIVLAIGGGLWATTMMSIISLFVALGWLITKWASLLILSWHNTSKKLEWYNEIWPQQWRIGLSWLSGYLLTQVYTPILFHIQDAVVAGQMGLSLTIANMLGLLAQSWIARGVPAMTQAAGRRDWQTLDRIFERDFSASIAMFVLGATLLCGLHIFLQLTSYGVRLLPFWSFLGLLGVALTSHFIGAFAAQLRSYLREPLTWLSVITALITVPISIWAAGVYSAGGVVSVIFSIQLLFTLPISVVIWKRRNYEWRAVA